MFPFQPRDCCSSCSIVARLQTARRRSEPHNSAAFPDQQCNQTEKNTKNPLRIGDAQTPNRNTTSDGALGFKKKHPLRKNMRKKWTRQKTIGPKIANSARKASI
jgi:hypothetical protein